MNPTQEQYGNTVHQVLHHGGSLPVTGLDVVASCWWRLAWCGSVLASI